jgi:hypothetical protein
MFSGRDGITTVDLHWLLTPRYFPFAPALDDVWRRAITMELDGVPIRTLSPADRLLFACVHSAKHGWSSLGEVSDMANLLARSAGLDWPALLDDARASGSRRMLALAVTLAHDLLDAPVPAEAAAVIAGDPAVRRLADRISRRLLTGTADGFFNDWLVPLLSIDRMAKRLGYAFDRTFAPTVDDWEFARLPARLFPLYYVIRPFRLALRR